MDRQIEIYKAYLAAKISKERTAIDVAREFNITRNGLYDIVRRFESGNVAKIKRLIERYRQQCYWTYKYQPRFEAIPKNRTGLAVEMLSKLIKDMSKDKFPIARIASLVGKDRSTILHHVEK